MEAMKTKVLTAIVAIAEMLGQCATAQTNETYAILRTLDGHAFTNAEVHSVTASDLTVFFDGGGARIAFTNLSPEIQKKYHFDPAAANAETAKRARSLQEFQQRQAQMFQAGNWRGETVKVRIMQMGPEIYEYKIATNGGVLLTVTMFKLPNDVTEFIQRMNSNSNTFADLKASIANQRQYAARQRSFANAMEHYNGDGSLNTDYPPQQYEANLAEARAREMSTQIDELTLELAKMRQEQLKKTTIMARPTNGFYGHQVWEFMSLPSDDNIDINGYPRNGRGH
jgi:hypothetical protein